MADATEIGAPARGRGARALTLAIARRVFTPVAFACLAYFAWSSRDTLASVLGQAAPVYFGFAIALWNLLHWLTPAFAMTVVNGFGATVGYRAAYLSHTGRLPARYIPGGIWHTVGRVVDFRNFGVTTSQLVAFVAMENLLAVLVTFVLGGACLFYFFGWNGWGRTGAFSAAFAAVSLITAPALLKRYLLRRNNPNIAAHVTYKTYLRALAITVVFWILAAGAFVTYLIGFAAPLGEISPLKAAGVYLFSWGTGYIAVFAPQGIGVFEVVAGELLETPLTLGATAALVAGFRIITLCADMLAWGISRFVQLRFARQGDHAP